MSAHRADLRAYIFAVARDLVARGVIRRKIGQTWAAVIQTAPREIGAEVLEDILAVFQEVGLTALVDAKDVGLHTLHRHVDRGVAGAHGLLDELARKGERHVVEWLMGLAKPKGK